MALIVQKFGGTSLATTERIIAVAKIIAKNKEAGDQIIVVVSAMAGITNQLVTLCNEVSGLKEQSNLSEYDMALSSGETVSAALLALALHEQNINARSIAAWQLPIITNNYHTASLVEKIDCELLTTCLQSNIVPIITGFAGITIENRVTTLGRGGSDTTAVLIAAAAKADRCDIYTDVEGIYSADPRIIHDAKILSSIYNLEMLEFASGGAKVLHTRSVEVAIRYNIPLKIISSFTPSGGTLITNKKDMEQPVITGVTYNKNLLKITINTTSLNYPDLFLHLVEKGVIIDSIINNQNNYQLILALNYRQVAEKILSDLQKTDKINDFDFDDKIAIVSIVGSGIKNNPVLLAQILQKLAVLGVNMDMLTMNEIRISILIAEDKAEQCVKALHELV